MSNHIDENGSIKGGTGLGRQGEVKKVESASVIPQRYHRLQPRCQKEHRTIDEDNQPDK